MERKIGAAVRRAMESEISLARMQVRNSGPRRVDMENLPMGDLSRAPTPPRGDNPYWEGALPNNGATGTTRWKYGIYGLAGAGVGLAATFADSRVRSVPYTSLTEHFDIAAMVICAGEVAIAHSISGRYECPNAKLFLNGGQDIDLSGQIDTCMKDVTNSNCWIPPLPPISEIRNYLGPAW